MFEKVNPSHPDKIADRIAGAIVDIAYQKALNPKIAVEVLIGHGECYVISETSERFMYCEIEQVVKRIAETNDIIVRYKEVPQDKHLADNQRQTIKCGDNGIFKGVYVNNQERYLTDFVRGYYESNKHDGKYIVWNKYFNCSDSGNLIIACQSHAKKNKIREHFSNHNFETINPLGDWTGGINVDTGATNRKLGSDMGRAVTGGGLHGKDLSKADVSINIYCHLWSQKHHRTCKALCAIGDKKVRFFYQDEFGWIKDEVDFGDIVKEARKYVKQIGGFEKLAEWGLIR